MTTQEAIDQLKYLSRLTKKEDAIYFFNRDAEAIDTVVQELERTIPTLKQSDDKRLLFSAYMQGKRAIPFQPTKMIKRSSQA